MDCQGGFKFVYTDQHILATKSGKWAICFQEPPEVDDSVLTVMTDFK